MSDDLAIFGRPHIMVDIESLSTAPNAVILSIGAVKFTFENGISDEFYLNVDPRSCKKRGMHISRSTVDWWKSKPATLKEMMKINRQPIDIALNKLNDFAGPKEASRYSKKSRLLWAQGAVFDFGVLSSAYRICDIEKTWNYWQEMDSRTIFTMIGVDNSKLRSSDTNYHNALSDARAQTETLINLFN